MPDNVKMSLDSEELDSYLDKIEKRWGNLHPFFVTIRTIMHRSIAMNFRLGGRPRKWKRHSKTTVAIRKKRRTWGMGGEGVGQPILQEYGTLLRSFQHGYEGHHEVIGSKHIEWGTNLEKASTLQNGAPARSGTARIKEHKRKRPLRKKTPTSKRRYHPKGMITVRAHSRRFRWGPIPARPFVLFQKEDVENIMSYAAAFSFAEVPPPPPIG